MKESTVAASEFKAKCLRLLDEVAEKGDTLIITKRGRPVAKVERIAPLRKPFWGSGRGKVKIKGDIVHFNVADEWENA